jgi:very-short-patch-repair endonuclease
MTRLSTDNRQSAMDNESILAILGQHPEGLTTEQVRSRLSAKGVKARIDELAERLRVLHKGGKVQFVSKGRLWKVGRASRRGSPNPPPGPKRRGGAPPPVSPGRSPPPAEPDVLAVAIAADVIRTPQAQSEASVPPKIAPAGEWDRFRTLLSYYQHCLAAEERADLITSWNRHGEQFVLLATQARWWPQPNDDVVVSINLGKLPQSFVEALSRRFGEQLYLGYPIQCVSQQTATPPQTFLYPVAVLPVDWTIKHEVLELRPAAQLPHLNARWTKYCRNAGRDMDKLLEWLGVANAADDSAETSEVSTLDFADFADALRLHFADSVKGALTPATPEGVLEATAPTGMRNALGLFLGDTRRYGKGAVRELRRLKTWSDAQLQGTALAALISGDIRDLPVGVERVVEPFPLGEDQLNAVRDGLTAPLIVITGPPGSGKSQMIAALMLCAAFAGRSALLASRNHKAIDAVQERLEAIADGTEILMRVSRPWGEGTGTDMTKSLDALLQKPGQPGARLELSQALERAAVLDQQRQEAMEELARLSVLANEFGEFEQTRLGLEASLGAAAACWLETRPVLPPWPNLPAWLGRLKARRWFPTAVRRALDRWQLRRAPALAWATFGWQDPTPDTLPQCRARYMAAREYLQVTAELETAEAALRNAPDQAVVAEQIVALSDRLLDQGRLLVKKLIAAMEDVSDEDRKALTNLRGELKIQARSRDRDSAWSAFARGLLGYFPLWATTSLSVAGRLPLEPALFDYVIFDEASQSDIASALPLLARARRAIVVGDPAQLRHVSSLSAGWERDTLANLQVKHDTPGIGRFLHTVGSLYDLAASSSGVKRVLLRDHFRCHEEIAAYVSDTFYGGQLRVLTPSAAIHPPPGTRPGLHWTEVEGPIAPAKSGCHAPTEATLVVEHAKDLLVKHGYEGSIGIVTPFREQATRITDLISERIPAALVARAGLRAFTAHRFQGDARDVILFSLCLGPDMPPGSLSYLKETGNLFNVAVTRARAVCHVFGNRKYAVSCGVPHVVRLVEAVDRRQARPPQGTFESPWERVLYDALVAGGIQPLPQYPLAGRRLDLAVVRPDRKLDIEVDGDAFHRDLDGMRRSSDIWRDHQIRGLGWEVVRFWVYQLKEDLDGCVERVRTLFADTA